MTFRLRPSESIAILLCLFFLTVSCGKKEPPRLPVYEKPDTPKALSAVHREGEILLSWTYPGKRDLIEGFAVFRSEDEVSKRIAFVKERFYADRAFEVGHVYSYRVAAKSVKKVQGDPSGAFEARPLSLPVPPTDLSYSIGSDYLDIVWTHPEGEAFFNVYKSAERGNYPLKPVNPEPLVGTVFRDGISTGAEVHYTVRAILGGQIRNESNPSGELTVSPEDFIPSAPAGMRAIPSNGVVVLAWKENPEAWVRGYRIYRAENGEFRFAGETQTPAFPDRTPPAEARYRVSALGPVSEGPLSEELTLHTPQ